MSTSATVVGVDIFSLRSQLDQLKALHAAGVLTDHAYNDARAALEQRILDITSKESPSQDLQTSETSLPGGGAASTAPSRILMFGLVSLVVLVTVGVATYFWLNRADKAIVDSASASASNPHPMVGTIQNAAPNNNKMEDLPVLTEKLAARLKNNPADAQGWAILARSYGVLGNHPDALKAYEKAIALLPNDGVLLADYAAELAAASQKGLTGTSAMPLSTLKPAVASSGNN